jgi:hypothetical protein
MTAFHIRFSLIVAFIVVPLMAGCGGDSHERFIPAADQARSAVDAALSSWKAGEPHKTLTNHKPPVDLFDARRQAGKKLEEFHIAEEVRGQQHPTFKVKLRLAGEKQDEETTYIVIGIDPLLVFRAEDYKKASGA